MRPGPACSDNMVGVVIIRRMPSDTGGGICITVGIVSIHKMLPISESRRIRSIPIAFVRMVMNDSLPGTSSQVSGTATSHSILSVTIFVQEEEDIFRRFTETHLQRGYTAEQMRALLEQAGLNVLEIMDSDTGEAATATSERVYIVAKEQQKELPTERYVK